MKRILFVDDEQNILDGLQRMLRPMRHEWEMDFAVGGEKALETLSTRPFDVVVSDMRMPGINGAQLLDEVMKRYPETVRIILSGYSDHELILKSVGPAHQFLSKPSNAESIKETVARACALRDLLADKTLQLLVSQMQSLPSLPSLFTELVNELRSPNVSMRKIGEIISKDLGMTAKILQMVNSAFFGIRRHISSPSEAVSLLGLDTIMTLVLTINVFSQVKQEAIPGFSLNALWSQSMRVGLLAKRIAQKSGQEAGIIKDAFTAGLLHDAGHLVLAANLPQDYARMLSLLKTDGSTCEDAERQVFGATHAEVGAYLLGLWGLPDPIVEAVAFHHQPGQCLAHGFGPITAVHAANALECETRKPTNGVRIEPIDLEYLTRLNLVNQLPAWREICANIAPGETE
jgi:HD-like signal output (HDOD) protein/CheY-like chemotaxis protein